MSSTSGWPNSYVRELHAAVSTPRRVLARLARRATGSSPERVDRIVDGYGNEVYRVRATRGADVIIRIRRFGGDLAAATAEADAIEAARSVGVPGPEVLLLDTVRIHGDTFPVMVQRAVPGRPLLDVYATLTTQERHHVLVQIGDLIARLNSIPATTDWTTDTTARVAERRAARALVLGGGFDAAEFDWMITTLDGYVEEFPCPRTVLCHGDLGPQHLFIENGSVSGVIDFGDAHAGSPIHDVAVLRVRGPHLDLAPVLSGYRAPSDAGFRRQLDLDTLLIALSSLEIGVSERDAACIRRASALIRSLVEALRRG